MNQACSGFFRREALKWSCLKEVFRVTCVFSKKKAHSLSVAPEPFAIWNKELEGLKSLSLEKLEISSEDMYPAALEHISGLFCSRRTRIEGLLSCSQVACFLSEVGGH
jgi:hypothetical protein